MFADIRQFVSLATYNASYDPEVEIPSGAGNIMDGVTTTNADIWPGGHGVAGWTNGDTVTANYTQFASGSPGSVYTANSISWTSE
mmetsp:Transcript_21005/g.52836  ORF Transcript_21005/g.52836 Transcript_21005/m.52836 type:complete len:85 (+) Transcript_21005:392-646(+)